MRLLIRIVKRVATIDDRNRIEKKLAEALKDEKDLNIEMQTLT